MGCRRLRWWYQASGRLKGVSGEKVVSEGLWLPEKGPARPSILATAHMAKNQAMHERDFLSVVCDQSWCLGTSEV